MKPGDSSTTIHPRINRGTYWLTKREEAGTDEFWVGLNFSEDARQGGDQFCRVGEVAIVGSILSGILPEPLGGVELRRIGRQGMHFQPVSVGAEPVPNRSILVIRGIVLNQNGSSVAVVPRQLLEEGQVRRSVEG